MARKTEEQKQAEAEAKAKAQAEKDAAKQAAAEAKAKEDAEKATTTKTSATVTGLGSRLRLVNTSRNIFIFPITQYLRESILPSKYWDVPDEQVEQVKKCLKGSYYKALIDKKLLKVVDVEPSRLGEADLMAPETPDAPADLSETSEHVTQAGFVKKD